MNDVRIARITGACGLACVALSVGQFPLWLGDYPSFYDGPGFARHLLAIKNIAFTRILMDYVRYQDVGADQRSSNPRRMFRQAGLSR
jgi:hypothetical protein